jgi:hypothetical protein
MPDEASLLKKEEILRLSDKFNKTFNDKMDMLESHILASVNSIKDIQ